MSRRLIASVAVLGAVAVPAVAELASPRATEQPVQLSINAASPAFALAAMVPGDLAVRCLRIRNEGSEPAALVEGVAITGGLAPYLRVAVERGSGLGDAGPSCAGFVPSGTFAYGTNGGGVAPGALVPDYDASLPAGATKSLRITVALPANAPAAAMAKQATVLVAFAGFPVSSGNDGDDTPDLPGGIAPGTTGGFDADGNFLSNSQIKKRLRIGRARLLKNGNVVVKMFLPAGGAIRAKVILPNGVYYAHTLLPEEWGPTVRVVLERRDVGRQATAKAKRTGAGLRTTVTTRYRWAHGPNAFVQPEQKLTIAKRRG